MLMPLSADDNSKAVTLCQIAIQFNQRTIICFANIKQAVLRRSKVFCSF